MGNKLALILSLGIIFYCFLFGVDLTMVQVSYTNLDSISTLVSYKISKEGKITDSLIEYCLDKNIIIEGVDNESAYQKGEIYEYYLKKDYKPVILDSKTIEISIKRYAVISIYN